MTTSPGDPVLTLGEALRAFTTSPVLQQFEKFVTEHQRSIRAALATYQRVAEQNRGLVERTDLTQRRMLAQQNRVVQQQQRQVAQQERRLVARSAQNHQQQVEALGVLVRSVMTSLTTGASAIPSAQTGSTEEAVNAGGRPDRSDEAKSAAAHLLTDQGLPATSEDQDIFLDLIEVTAKTDTAELAVVQAAVSQEELDRCAAVAPLLLGKDLLQYYGAGIAGVIVYISVSVCMLILIYLATGGDPALTTQFTLVGLLQQATAEAAKRGKGAAHNRLSRSADD